jgi:hypothetical protein
MKCFDGLIGIKGLCNKTYRYNLDDLGISLHTASKLSDEKFNYSGQKLIESKINEAINITISDLAFGSKITRPIIDDISIDNFFNPVSYTYNGTITHSFKSKNCKYSKFYIGLVKFQVAQTGSLTINLKENNTTTTIYTGTPTEDVELYLNKEYGDFAIEIIGGGGLKTYTSGLPNMGYVTASQGQTYGLNIDFQLRCSIEKHVCKFADLIANVARYKAAAMLLNEINLTNNLNEFIICKDKADLFIQMAMLDSTYNLRQYEAEFNPENGMYQTELNKLKLPPLECSCCCEECKDKNYIHELNLP